ncbi:phage integrase SAM-like domain-containing protein [Bacteroides nordii]|uniref:phage integrase SAM-like domain-containing protein n=1 Tax=Bacteroides nordii TaxID=291645 RepID=UPI002A7EEC77|nr:phage integrase SAM-like domain-containing protein [Bacteroides nordii]
MATLNVVILPAKALKGGKHKIRIAVAHNSETRYIVTDILIDSDKEFKKGQVIKRPDAAHKNTKIRAIMQSIQESIDKIKCIECLTCSELISLIQKSKNTKNRTLSSVFDEYILYLNIKASSAELYKSCFNAIISFIGDKTLVSDINHRTIISFDKFMRDKKLSNSTIRSRMLLLSQILKYSVRCMYAEYNIDPFSGYKIPSTGVRNAWLTVEQIRSIRDVGLKTKKKNIIKCRDLFMLSYYLGGINFCDLIKIDFNKQHKTLKYIRTKTERESKLNEYVEFDIPQEAFPIINKYKQADGKLYFSSQQEIHYASHFLTHNMPLLASKAGIKKIIYYSARKSFSQHAFALGVDTSIIDYILGHKIGNASSCLYSYIKVTPDMATNAIRKVLDNLK